MKADDFLFLESVLPVLPHNPKPVKLYINIHTKDVISQIRSDLYKKSGIYALINSIDGKLYIGSGVNLYRRFSDHLKGRSSNLRLQRAIKVHKIKNFYFVVYAFVENSVPGITDMETLFMSYFSKEKLYNFKYEATSMAGYRHTEEAIKKMKSRFLDPKNHPMYGKSHSLDVKNLISKPGNLNPMYGKEQSNLTRSKISERLSKPVALYDADHTYILTFKSNVQLSKFLECDKSTVGDYVKSGKLFKELYYIKKDNTIKKISTHYKSIPINLYDLNNKIIQTFNSQREVSQFLNCDKTTVSSYLKSGKKYKNMYYIKKRIN